MATLKVKIRNETGLTDPQRYIAFFGDVSGKVQSNSNQQLRSVVFFRTKPLSNGQVDEFKLTPELYGFVGGSSAQSLAPTHTVNLGFSEEVKLGEENQNNGTELVVKPSGNYVQLTKATTDKSGEGTFTVWSQNGIPSPNRFVTGLARNINNDIKPVAALPLIPGQKFIIMPSLILYVALSSDDDEDTIVDGNKAGLLKQKIEIEAGQTLVIVTNKVEATKNVLKVA